MKGRSHLAWFTVLGLTFALLASLSVGQGFGFPKPANHERGQWEKHNRKMLQLEQKRIKKRSQLERDYQKLFQRNGPVNGQKMLKLQEKFQKKLQKIDQDYYRKLQELERKRK